MRKKVPTQLTESVAVSEKTVFCVFDVETTDSSRQHGRIIQLSAILLRVHEATCDDVCIEPRLHPDGHPDWLVATAANGLEELGTWSCYGDREGRTIGKYEIGTHGLTHAKLARKGPASQNAMLKGFLQFIRDHCRTDDQVVLTAHNGLSVDWRYLYNSFKRENLDLPRNAFLGFDTFRTATDELLRLTHKPGTPRRLRKGTTTLNGLYLTITRRYMENHHDAAADTRAMIPILHWLRPVWSKGHDFHDLRRLAADEARRAAARQAAGARVVRAARDGYGSDLDGSGLEEEEGAEDRAGPGTEGLEWEGTEETKAFANNFPSDVQVGPNGREWSKRTPFEVMERLLTPMFEIIVEESNRYRRQQWARGVIELFCCTYIRRVKLVRGEAKLAEGETGPPHWPDPDTIAFTVNPFTLKEIRLWHAILVHKSLLKGKSTWWKRAPVYSNARMFTDLMTEARFDEIKRYYHASDVRDVPTPAEVEAGAKVDPLFKIRRVLDNALHTWRMCFTPGMSLAVDESMQGFEGRAWFRTVMARKAHDTGFKWWMLCCSTTGFVIYMILKTDKWVTTATTKFEGTHVTIEMLVRSGVAESRIRRTLYSDNYFTSFELAKKLAAMCIYLVGMLRNGRCPEQAKFNAMDGEVTRGSSKIVKLKGGFDAGADLHIVTWKDARELHVMTTAGTGGKHKALRWIKERRRRELVDCPGVIQRYNADMGSIDNQDGGRSYFSMSDQLKGTRKWPIRTCLHIADTHWHNGRVIYNEAQHRRDPSSKKIGFRRFREMYLEELYGELQLPLAREAVAATAKAALLRHNPGKCTLKRQQSSKDPRPKTVRLPCVVCLKFGAHKNKARCTTWCSTGDCRNATPAHGVCGVPLCVVGEDYQGEAKYADPEGRSCFRRWHEDAGSFSDVRAACQRNYVKAVLAARAAGAGAGAGSAVTTPRNSKSHKGRKRRAQSPAGSRGRSKTARL